ncbi:MAG: amino acid ABC transporter permease [Methyloligellaceae bacterium]
MDFDFAGVVHHLPQYVQGALITLGVSVPGAFFGIVVGLILIAGQRVPLAPIRWLSSLYISFIRGTPLLVQIFLVYYALPGLFGFNLDPFVAGILALSLNSGAFVTEILRAGLSSIPKGQWDAAMSIGLPPFKRWRYIILPQLFYKILPPLTNEFTMVVKATPLLSVITVVELTRVAQHTMNDTYRPVEAFLVAALFYFVMLFALSRVTRKLEAWTEAYRA